MWTRHRAVRLVVGRSLVYRGVAYRSLVYRAVGRLENMDSSCKHGRRLRVFENRVLRRIFVPKRDEVTGGVEKTT